MNGYAKVYNLPKGFYQVVEVEPPQGYLKDEVEHEVYIDPSADPTQIVRAVNVPNTKKLSIRIIKQDKDCLLYTSRQMAMVKLFFLTYPSTPMSPSRKPKHRRATPVSYTHLIMFCVCC